MRVWIDLANSPHVPLFEPIVRALDERGDTVLLSARDHAQTVELAQSLWPEVRIVSGASPPGRVGKAAAIAARALELRRLRRRLRPDVALSHGSYAQILACAGSRVPAVTMMDYEFQPANHVSFRLADRIVVPEAFPDAALRRFGARPRKVVRYEGFKEELYLSDFQPTNDVADELGLDAGNVVAVFRPPPDGALYHRLENPRFDELLDEASSRPGVQVVVLPRTATQGERYASRALVPDRAVDGAALLSLADVVVGGGGTMTREAALLGTPTYTVFAGSLAAVDQALIDRGLLFDLRDPSTTPAFVKKPAGRVLASHGPELLRTVLDALDDAA